jgi:hypothetical protein
MSTCPEPGQPAASLPLATMTGLERACDSFQYCDISSMLVGHAEPGVQGGGVPTAPHRGFCLLVHIKCFQNKGQYVPGVQKTWSYG